MSPCPPRALPPGATRWLLWTLLLLFGSSVSRAQTNASREYQIKAVFLFNFAQFVEWPPAAFSDPRAPVVIGVLGDDPFGSYLDETVRGEIIGGRPLVVQRYRSVEEVNTCHILFLAPSEAGRVDTVLAALRARPILTVSDLEGFAGRGGMIQLFTERGKVRLRINPAPAKTSGVAISSKLFRPAEIIAPAIP